MRKKTDCWVLLGGPFSSMDRRFAKLLFWNCGVLIITGYPFEILRYLYKLRYEKEAISDSEYNHMIHSFEVRDRSRCRSYLCGVCKIIIVESVDTTTNFTNCEVLGEVGASCDTIIVSTGKFHGRRVRNVFRRKFKELLIKLRLKSSGEPEGLMAKLMYYITILLGPFGPDVSMVISIISRPKEFLKYLR